MPSLIDIRRRIRSVKNTQQITKAMKMVSAAKLRRAQDRVVAARPYASMLERILQNVARAASGDNEEVAGHPLLQRRPENRILLLVVTADRGLAGAFNANVIRAAQRFLEAHDTAEISLELMGRRGRDFFRRRHPRIAGEYTALFLRSVAYETAIEIARSVAERFSKEDFDAVYIIANYFKSVVTSELVTRRILPIDLPEGEIQTDYIFEQEPAQLLTTLLPRYVELEVYRAMLESAAAEHAARMTAMDAASSNAADMIEKLTLNMNRVRQASITREIIEIVSGATALE
jgi:F-type H+-transporting ATPase subunit gamma